jgi:hypothetical protein
MPFSRNGQHLPIWRARSLCSGYEWQGPLVAYWEVLLDPISDDYTPEDTSAEDLLQTWVDRVLRDCPSDMVPIYWFAAAQEHGMLERMPFQVNDTPELPVEDFLTYFTWPVNTATREQLNWLKLPVMDKRWNLERADKGGFIQEATGWKPAILQPYVYLPALVQGRCPTGRR